MYNVQGTGNSSSEVVYRKVDKNPYNTRTYYRLTQTDFDGTTKELAIVMVSIDKAKGQLKVFPNPAKDVLIIEGINSDKDIISISNALGQSCRIQEISNSNHSVRFGLSSLKSGIYFVNTTSGSFKFIKK